MGNLFFKAFMSIFLSLMMISSFHVNAQSLAEFNLSSPQVADGGFTNESFVAIKIKQQEAEWMVNNQIRELWNWTTNSFSISGLTYIRTVGPEYIGPGASGFRSHCWLIGDGLTTPCNNEGGFDGTQFFELDENAIIVEVSSDVDGAKSFTLNEGGLFNSRSEGAQEATFIWVQQANPATATVSYTHLTLPTKRIV